MKVKVICIILVMFVFCAVTGIYAEDKGEVVITASRQPMQMRDTADIVQIIDQNDIKEINPASTGELIEYTTGVAIETGTGSGLPDRSIVSLNGLPANYTLVLVDGVRLLSEHMHTGQNLESIPPESIERIEIIRGSASAQYGTDAIGGIVNIITRKAGDKPQGSIGMAIGSYETYEGSLDLLVPVNDNFSFSSFLKWEESDGVPILAPAHRIDNMGYDRLNFFNRADITISEDTKIFGTFNWVRNHMDWRGDTAESELVAPSFGFDHYITPNLSLAGNAAYSDWSAETSGERNILFEPEVYTHWQANDNHTLMTGVEYKNNEFERSAVEDAPNQEAYGIFLQDEWTYNDAFVLMTALRYDTVEDIDSALSPKLSLMFLPAEKMRVRASVARGFHAPTLQELYEEGYGHSGRAYRFGNEDLDPEYSTTYTLGFEVQPADPVQIMIYGHYSDLDDMIVPVYEGVWDEDSTVDVWRRMNISNAEVYGGEASVILSMGKHVKLEGGYTYTGNENKDTGRQLPYSPGSAINSKLVLTHNLTQKVCVDGFVGVSAQFNREAWNWKPAGGTDPDNPDGLTTELDDYTDLDAGITVSISDDYKFFVKVQNILGEDIEHLDDNYTVIDGEPTIRVGFNYNFPFAK